MSVKALYCGIVRPIIECGCVVWDPHKTNNSRQLEQIQQKLLHLMKLPKKPIIV